MNHPIDNLADWILSRPRFCFCRMYFCAALLGTCWIATFVSFSLNRDAFTQLAGDFGWLAVALLTTAGIVGIADVVMNDLTHKRWKWAWIKRHRWKIYMTVSLTLAVFIFINAGLYEFNGVMVRWIIDCLWGLVLAALELIPRGQPTYREATV